MKIFWSLIALLVAGLTATILLPSSNQKDGEAIPTAMDSEDPVLTGTPDRPVSPQMQTMPEMQPMPAMDEGPQNSAETTDGSLVETELLSSNTTDLDAVIEETSRDRPSPVGDLVVSDSMPTEGARAEEQETAAAGVTWDDILGAISDDAMLAAAPTETAESGLESEAAGAEVAANDSAADSQTDSASLELRDLPDGTTLVNERFTIAGDGSKTHPYEITWDYLTSAREGYLPREGKTEIPAHVAMLDGKYVRLGGYLQFPLATPEPKELLVMLNQWDGCCIGVPPTPYDAVEVSLTTPATRGEKFAVEGSLVGKLKIDPYLVGDWLIGLYLIGDATLDVSGSRSAEEVYGNSPTVGDPNAMPGG